MIHKTKSITLKKQLGVQLDQNAVEMVDRTICIKHTAGMLFVRIRYLSIDPYIRNRLTPGRTRYISSLCVGNSLISMGIAEVLESFCNTFSRGDLIIGMLPWQEFDLVNASDYRHIPVEYSIPTAYYLGLLGYPGLTAYVGIKLANLNKNQTVYVSSAAGAVGHIAGQLAKLYGCYLIGSAGTDEKVCHLKEHYQLDQAFNYKKYNFDYNTALKKYCPNGIDVNFENVGGHMLEAVINHLNDYGKVIFCGAISQYNIHDVFKGPANFSTVMKKNIEFIPYIVTDYEYLYDNFLKEVTMYFLNKKLVYQETIVNGLENAWQALIDLFQGKYYGKVIISV